MEIETINPNLKIIYIQYLPEGQYPINDRFSSLFWNLMTFLSQKDGNTIGKVMKQYSHKRTKGIMEASYRVESKKR